MTKDAAGEGPVDIAVRPCAWRWPVMKLRGVDWRYTKHLPQHENCEPLYGLPALDAAVAAERERWLETVQHAANELAELDDETAQVQAAALRALCGA